MIVSFVSSWRLFTGPYGAVKSVWMPHVIAVNRRNAAPWGPPCDLQINSTLCWSIGLTLTNCMCTDSRVCYEQKYREVVCDWLHTHWAGPTGETLQQYFWTFLCKAVFVLFVTFQGLLYISASKSPRCSNGSPTRSKIFTSQVKSLLRTNFLPRRP